MFARKEILPTFAPANKKGQLPEWPNGADCNSAGLRLRWFESITAHFESKAKEVLPQKHLLSFYPHPCATAAR